jgi:hypothetical protein
MIFYPAGITGFCLKADHLGKLFLTESLLEALLHVVETKAIQDQDTEATKHRLTRMIAKETERLLALRNAPPFCWAEQLQDAQWLNERRAVLDVAIQQESERWAILTSRYAGIKTQVHPG